MSYSAIEIYARWSFVSFEIFNNMLLFPVAHQSDHSICYVYNGTCTTGKMVAVNEIESELFFQKDTKSRREFFYKKNGLFKLNQVRISSINPQTRSTHQANPRAKKPVEKQLYILFKIKFPRI